MTDLLAGIREQANLRATIAKQIGHLNILSISGGRIRSIHDGIELPVSNGYAVRVTYDWGSDTYDVARIFARAGKEWVKGSKDNVYCDELGEQAYRAGMFKSYDEDEW